MNLRSILHCAALVIATALVVAAPIRAHSAEPSAQQRRAFTAALAAARNGTSGWQDLGRGLEDYPLYPYLPYSALVRDLERADPRAVADFLARHDGSLLADRLRTRWLSRLAARSRWPELIAAWRAQDDIALRCQHGQARIATAATTGLGEQMRTLWLTGASLPPACDPVIAWLRAEGLLTPKFIRQRIELAAIARNGALISSLASALPADRRAEVLRFAALARDPAGQLVAASSWADTARARRHIAIAVARVARNDSTLAATRWNIIEPRFAFTDVDRARAIGPIALNKAASYTTDARTWMARLPADGVEDGVREWRLREALARADWKAASVAVAGLSPAQQLDPRFRWLRGRLLELQGQSLAAYAAWESLAGEANFHGFLAADRLDRAYSICPMAPSDDGALRAKVAADPGLRSAFEWMAIGRHDEARREWNHTLARMAAPERPLAVEFALARDWTDRGPLTLLRPEELRYYALRFPLAHRDEVDTHARRLRLDRGLVYGLIRSESAWVVDARSAADARGLMQMLPSTAVRVAKLERARYTTANDLYRPPLAIALGTRYLADELKRWNQRQWVAAASYNAGPAPVIRWLAARSSLPPDIWIETIPYRETREYVSRVMAFATLYDWRLGEGVKRISHRIGLDGADTAPVAVACATVAGSNPQAVNP
jgi:soluble lytic murein transglycosylase